MKVQIVEVGARDGLQNEKMVVPIGERVRLIEKLASVGLKRIEAGAFVSPKWVPQMEDSVEVFRRLRSHAPEIDGRVRLSALVPNPRGMEDALRAEVKEVAIFGACSESFSQRNINCTMEESLKRFSEVIAVAKKNKIRVRGYLSVALGCPYEGYVPEKRVVNLTEALLSMGVYEVSIGDTIGVATPRQVRILLEKLQRKVNLKKVALHLHDTRGTAIANVVQGLDMGVRVFDSSVGGLGGCPYAKGASGNLATEDLVYLLEGMGVRTGIDLKKLIELRDFVRDLVQHDLPGRVSKASLPLPRTLEQKFP